MINCTKKNFGYLWDFYCGLYVNHTCSANPMSNMTTFGQNDNGIFLLKHFFFLVVRVECINIYPVDCINTYQNMFPFSHNFKRETECYFHMWLFPAPSPHVCTLSSKTLKLFVHILNMDFPCNFLIPIKCCRGDTA